MVPLAVPKSGIWLRSMALMAASAPAPLVRPIKAATFEPSRVLTFWAQRSGVPASSRVISSKRVPPALEAASKAATMPARMSRP